MSAQDFVLSVECGWRVFERWAPPSPIIPAPHRALGGGVPHRGPVHRWPLPGSWQRLRAAPPGQGGVQLSGPGRGCAGHLLPGAAFKGRGGRKVEREAGAAPLTARHRQLD